MSRTASGEVRLRPEVPQYGTVPRSTSRWARGSVPSKQAQTVLGLGVGLIVVVGLAPLVAAAPVGSDPRSGPIVLIEVAPAAVFEAQPSTPEPTVTSPAATSARVVEVAPAQQVPDSTARPSPRPKPTKATKPANPAKPAPAAPTPTSTPTPTPEPKAAATPDTTPKPKPEPKPKKDPKPPKPPKPGG